MLLQDKGPDSNSCDLQLLGFEVNLEKSKLELTQKIEFLGFLNSVRMLISFPEEKVVKIKQECHQTQNRGKIVIDPLAASPTLVN